MNFGGIYIHNRRSVRGARRALKDAPNIHLEEPFVNKVQKEDGGVVLFLHVPFTVTKAVQAQSLRYLAPYRLSVNPIRYSVKPYCNDPHEEPTYGFHLVLREHTGSQKPSSTSITEIVADKLQPAKRYYLLRELHFIHPSCRVSDYDDFDPQELEIRLDISRAEQTLLNGFFS
jgi:hypothetical protein